MRSIWRVYGVVLGSVGLPALACGIDSRSFVPGEPSLSQADASSGTPSESQPSTNVGGATGDGGTTQPYGPGSSNGGAPPVEGSANSGAEPVVDEGEAAAFQVIGVEPAEQSVAIATTARIRFTLSRPINPASVPPDAVRLVDGAARVVAGAIDVSGAVITFTPGRPLHLANGYTASLEGAITAADGAALTPAAPSHFTTRDGAWAEPENVSLAGASPRVALDGAGNAVVIWEEQAPGCTPGAALYAAATGWSRLANLPAGSSGPFCAPLAASADADGTYVFAWDTLDYIFAVDFHPGRGFGTPRQASGYSSFADAAIQTGRGWFAANAFQGESGLQISELSPEAGWSAMRQVFPLPGEPIGSTIDAIQVPVGPVLALAPSGHTRMFWSFDEDADTRGVYFASYAPGSDWSQAQTIASYSAATHDILGLKATVSASGEALAVWEVHQRSLDLPDQLSTSVEWADIAADGTAAEPDRVRPAGVNTMEPAAALGVADDAVLLWLQSDGAPADDLAPRVWGMFRPLGSTAWAAPQPLSIGGPSRARSPRVALDPSGNGHAFWVEAQEADRGQAYVARWLRGSSTFGAPALISGATPVSTAATVASTQEQDSPQIEVDATGRAIAVWVGPAGGIWAARFE